MRDGCAHTLHTGACREFSIYMDIVTFSYSYNSNHKSNDWKEKKANYINQSISLSSAGKSSKTKLTLYQAAKQEELVWMSK